MMTHRLQNGPEPPLPNLLNYHPGPGDSKTIRFSPEEMCGGFIYAGCVEYTQDSTVEVASDEEKQTVRLEPLIQGTFVKC